MISPRKPSSGRGKRPQVTLRGSMDRHQRQLQKAAAAPITFPFRRQPFCAYQAADPDAWNKCQQREYDCQKIFTPVWACLPYRRACAYSSPEPTVAHDTRPQQRASRRRGPP